MRREGAQSTRIMEDFTKASQVRHLYTSAGGYRSVHLRAPNGESACLCGFLSVGGPLCTLSVLLLAGAGQLF